MNTYLDFEKPIEALDVRISDLKKLNENNPSENNIDEIKKIEVEISSTYKNIISNIQS